MRQPNIALIVLDTLRKDVLYRRLEDLPAMRVLMKEAVRYENAKTPASWTLPSHVSIFTGRYPSSHGVHYYCNRDDSDRLMATRLREYSESHDVLPNQLRKKAYQTISLSANLLVSEGTGMENGFDVCEAIGPWATIATATKTILKMPGERITKKRGSLFRQVMQEPVSTFRKAKTFASAKASLIAGGFPRNKGGSALLSRLEYLKLEEPFFVFLNLMEAHEPYLPFHSPFSLQPDSFREQLRDLSNIEVINESKFARIKNRYNEEVNKIDRLIGRFIKHLKAIDEYDNTLIVVTSDHGQCLKEHGFFGHGLFLHDEITDIPLIVKYPKGQKMESDTQYRTLLDLKSFFESWGDGEKTDFPGSLAVYAESYGVPKRMLKDNLKPDFRLPDNVLRKCLWKNGHKLTVDGTNGRVESLEQGGVNIDVESKSGVVQDMSSDLELFIGSEDFLIP